MSVRRLADKQPPSFAFTPENLEWAKARMAKYPPGRQQSAVIPILWRAQEQCGGWLPQKAIEATAELLGMARIRVLEVATFYTRIQAHFDAAMAGYREEQRSEQEWKQDPTTLEFLAALDAIEVKMEERYLRALIQQHRIFVLSTQSADEMNIAYLCDYVMGVPARDLVGAASAPPDEPTERDLAWFFKLFSLRGMGEGKEERMCFFAFLQKSDGEEF